MCACVRERERESVIIEYLVPREETSREGAERSVYSAWPSRESSFFRASSVSCMCVCEREFVCALSKVTTTLGAINIGLWSPICVNVTSKERCGRH